MSVEGWYGPPGSRRWHWIGDNALSLCGKWFIPGWREELKDVALGPANGDCAACRKLVDKLNA